MKLLCSLVVQQQGEQTVAGLGVVSSYALCQFVMYVDGMISSAPL